MSTGGRDTVLVLSGLLHDAIEDTDTSLAEPAAEFGQDLGRGASSVGNFTA